jgi:hypothetical protein
VEPNRGPRCSTAQDRSAPAVSGRPAEKGTAMYSIFYIIGVIVVILAVLQLIA